MWTHHQNTTMDLKSLRVPTHTALEFAAARASTQDRAPRHVSASAKAERVVAPVVRDALWQGFYDGAVRDNHPEPERLADAAVRSRENTLRKKAERSKIQVLMSPPKVPVGAETGAKQKASGGPKCQAKTLEGRPCGFSATCGRFCKKHAPAAVPPAFQLVLDARRFTNVRLKGYLNASQADVAKVFGRPNGPPCDELASEWRLVFPDGTPATLFFQRTDPALHVCGEDVGVLGRVRKLLGL